MERKQAYMTRLYNTACIKYTIQDYSEFYFHLKSNNNQACVCRELMWFWSWTD